MTQVSTATRYDTAMVYIRRGWATIPLHWVRPDGACSCKVADVDPDHGPGGKSVGKHPLTKGWQSGPAMSAADAYAIWGEEHPQANVGIRTGTASGVFVLDVDPDNGGDVALAAMIKANGPLPATFTVRTGSGGCHYYWTLPPFKVTNGANRVLVAEYGRGLDIRGEGGQVVAPPSVSAKGSYEVLDHTDPQPAPGWLLELLQATVDTMPSVDSPVVEDLPTVADLDGRTADRVQRYAERVVDQEVREYVEAPPGTGNASLFKAAASMIEIAQSPWNSITVPDVYRRLDEARQERARLHQYGGGQDAQEFQVTWESARNRVIGQGRELPQDPHAGVAFDPSLFLPPGTARVEADAPTNREEATSLVDQLLARMLKRDDLDDIPAPEPLIRDVLDLDSESWVIGAPGGFKSFVALDWACHVALGRPWRGHPVTQGDVVYVVAEGRKGIPLRVRAWEALNGGRVDNLWVLPEPVQVKGEDTKRTGKPGVEWMTLVGACARIKPRLIVLDTQARITLGLNENDSSEMGTLTEAVRLLKEHTGACVLVVHHTGRAGENARGSSAIDGAQDTELRVDRKGKELAATIKIDKQKDGDESLEWPFTLRVMELGHAPDGRMLTSLAIEPKDPFTVQPTTPPGEWEAKLTDNQAMVVAAMRDHADASGCTKSELARWIKERAAAGHGKDMKRTSLDSALRGLKRAGTVVELGARLALQEHLDAPPDAVPGA